MATIDLGKIKPVWKGTWAGSTVYEKNDMVVQGVNSYICTTAHTSSGTFSSDTANWDVMAYGAELPAQTGNAGLALKTDGTNLSWGSAGGLVKILEYSNANLNASSWDINNVFSADYQMYKMVVQYYPQSDAPGVEMRLLAGATQDATANYHSVMAGGEASSASANNTQASFRVGDSWSIRPAGGGVGSNTSFGGCHTEFTFYDMYNSSTYPKYHASYSMMRDLGDNIHCGNLAGIFKNNVSSQYTGVRLFGLSSNFGRVKVVVYGFEGSS